MKTIKITPKLLNEYANIFYVHNYQNWDKVIWHSIYSETDRFSLGFNFKPK